MTITISGFKHTTITCTTQAEIDAIASACRVIARGFEMRATVNGSEQKRIAEIADQFNRRERRPGVVATASGPASLRVLCGVGENSETAPETIEKDGAELQFTGYGKTFRLDPDTAAANGIEPRFQSARYAYYR